ncbi:hypothetical protein BDV93DRAFT_454284, partial [Ceratobasidium sp. AG-I]
VPTFASTIRLFSQDVASMGRLAAQDQEDILQCCIPVFEGLLPNICDELAQQLIFTFAKWHGLAKLRLHTTTTLAILNTLTTKLGSALQNFGKLTEGLNVCETPKEYARRRKQYESSKASSGARHAKAPTTDTSETSGDGRRQCVLNLSTYKMHLLGDYASTIGEYGTTDFYSTQIVCAASVLPSIKSHYILFLLFYRANFKIAKSRRNTSKPTSEMPCSK